MMKNLIYKLNKRTPLRALHVDWFIFVVTDVHPLNYNKLVVCILFNQRHVRSYTQIPRDKTIHDVMFICSVLPKWEGEIKISCQCLAASNQSVVISISGASTRSFRHLVRHFRSPQPLLLCH